MFGTRAEPRLEVTISPVGAKWDVEQMFCIRRLFNGSGTTVLSKERADMPKKNDRTVGDVSESRLTAVGWQWAELHRLLGSQPVSANPYIKTVSIRFLEQRYFIVVRGDLDGNDVVCMFEIADLAALPGKLLHTLKKGSWKADKYSLFNRAR